MSGYVHSGINPMIKVEPYKHENKVLVANKYGNAKVSDIKESDVTNVIQSVGNLNNLNTTDKSNIVAAMNELVASGSGSEDEEEFSLVYSETLDGASASNIYILSAGDLGGAYVDVFVTLTFMTSSSSGTNIIWYLRTSSPSDVTNSRLLLYSEDELGENSNCYCVAGVVSLGGLSAAFSSSGKQGTFKPISNSVTFGPWAVDLNGGSMPSSKVLYPHENETDYDDLTAVRFIQMELDSGKVFPNGTKIEVYARKLVEVV